jgi:hypothetical protein
MIQINFKKGEYFERKEINIDETDINDLKKEICELYNKSEKDNREWEDLKFLYLFRKLRDLKLLDKSCGAINPVYLIFKSKVLWIDAKTSVKTENDKFREFSLENIKIKRDATIGKIKKIICEKFNEKMDAKYSKDQVKLYYLGKKITKYLKEDTQTLEDLFKLFQEKNFKENKLNNPIICKFSKKVLK